MSNDNALDEAWDILISLLRDIDSQILPFPQQKFKLS